MEKYEPETVIRTSLADYKNTYNLLDVPLYCIENIEDTIEIK